MKSWNKEVWIQVILNCSWTPSVSLVWKEQGKERSRWLSEGASHSGSAQHTTVCFPKFHISRHFITHVFLHIFILHMNLWIPKVSWRIAEPTPILNLQLVINYLCVLFPSHAKCRWRTVWHRHNSSTGCACIVVSGDFPSYPRKPQR